jgi:hypothetical protein
MDITITGTLITMDIITVTPVTGTPIIMISITPTGG